MEVLILGAGPAGLSAALELDRGGKSLRIVEKNNEVGGLCRTLRYGDFKTDIGPHRFFSQNQELYDLISGLLGPSWIKVDRLTRFFIKGKFYSYPIDLKDALSKAGFLTSTKIGFDYFCERVKKIFYRREPANLAEKFIGDFGRGLAEFNMLHYNQKLWGLPASQLSVDWADQRIKDLSLWSVLKKVFLKNQGGPKTLVDQFYYPNEGAVLIYERMKERVEKSQKDAFQLNSQPIRIQHNGQKIQQARIKTFNGVVQYQPRFLISSIPITDLLSLLDPQPPEFVRQAAQHLSYRAHVALFIALNKERVFPDQWLYFPDKDVPFCRMMEPRNFSGALSPDRKTSLVVEFFCNEGDVVWQKSVFELLNMTLPWLEQMKFLRKEEVLECHIHREPKAYVVYDLDYKIHLKVVKDYLLKLENLQCVGRAGSFRYNNQDQAIEAGLLAARNILAGEKKYRADAVGEGEKYLERGTIK